jgi:hypothetical protein
VDQADLLRLGGLDALAFHQQRRGSLHADQARHALCATGAGQQAEGDFGEAEARLRVVGGDAVVATQRDLHAAAQGGSVDRGSNRLAAEFDGAHQLVGLADRGMEGGRIGRPGEFGEVAAGDEILLRRSDNDALDGRVRQRLLHGGGVSAEG